MKLLRAREYAEKMSISKETAWKWAREGKVETVKVGRTIRFVWREI